MGTDGDTSGQYDEFLSEEVQRLGPAKIRLIKRLREHSGLGLKEAKDIVEDFGARRCLELAARAGTGCLGVVLTLPVAALREWAG